MNIAHLLALVKKYSQEKYVTHAYIDKIRTDLLSYYPVSDIINKQIETRYYRFSKDNLPST
jgi:hypothetical protein